MPLWDFHTSPSLFSTAEKRSLVAEITKHYVEYVGLPAFYVVVRFTEHEPGNVFVGGEEHTKYANLLIRHIARHIDAEETKRFLGKVDSILDPVLKPKGADWEYWLTETPREAWKLNGLVPPPSFSEAEKEWARLNRAVEY